VLEVGLVKTVQMQTVTSGENQVIDSAQPCKKVFGRFFIGNVDRLAFGFSGNTADRSLDLFRVARSDYYVGALGGCQLRDCKPDAR
jgi:hypothetical protein